MAGTIEGYGDEVSSPIVAVIDCRHIDNVKLVDAVVVDEGEEVTLIPSLNGGILIVGRVTEANESTVLQLIRKASEQHLPNAG